MRCSVLLLLALLHASDALVATTRHAVVATTRHAVVGTTRHAAVAETRRHRVHRCASVVALDEDGWLQSAERQPFSSESLEVLFKYGPVVYGNRVWQAEEYDASVRQLMARYPTISRALAEQEHHEFIADSTGYMARTTAESYEGPKESDLKPAVGLMDKALVVAWVAILVPTASWITQLSLNAPPVDPPAVVQLMEGGGMADPFESFSE